MKNCYKLLCLLTLCQPLVGAAQAQEQITPAPTRWYVGVQGGAPFGVSSFSSFGADKTRPGYNFGALAGYRLSPLLQAEFSAMFGRMNLWATDCCAAYYLGENGKRYLSPVAGMESYSYGEIYSSVFVQQYALRLHIDLLQLAQPYFNKRWSLTLSPAIYGVGSRATIRTEADKAEFYRADGRFGFGAGADVGMGYRITDRLGIRVMSGVNFVVGESFDGIPDGTHNQNMVWNTNLALTWSFGSRKGIKQHRTTPQTTVIVLPAERQIQPEPQAEAVDPQPETPMPLQPAPQPQEIQSPAPQAEAVDPQPEPQAELQPTTVLQGDSAVIRFMPNSSTFVLFHKDNLQATQQITAWLDEQTRLADRVVVAVDSYTLNDRTSAWYQANHVKSYLIGLGKAKESNFKTTLHTQGYTDGQNAVVVRLCNQAATLNK